MHTSRVNTSPSPVHELAEVVVGLIIAVPMALIILLVVVAVLGALGTEYTGPTEDVEVMGGTLWEYAKLCSTQDPEQRSVNYWMYKLARYNGETFRAGQPHLIVPAFLEIPDRYRLPFSDSPARKSIGRAEIAR